MQAVGGRVEADVERHRTALEPLAQRVEVGVVLHQPAREQVVDDGGAPHAGSVARPRLGDEQGALEREQRALLVEAAAVAAEAVRRRAPGGTGR